MYVLLLCCFLFNSNRLGFRLCFCVGNLFSTCLVTFLFIEVLVIRLDWVFKNNPNQLGLRLCVCEWNPFSIVLFLLNLHSFFENLSRFKFIRGIFIPDGFIHHRAPLLSSVAFASDFQPFWSHSNSLKC